MDLVDSFELLDQKSVMAMNMSTVQYLTKAENVVDRTLCIECPSFF